MVTGFVGLVVGRNGRGGRIADWRGDVGIISIFPQSIPESGRIGVLVHGEQLRRGPSLFHAAGGGSNGFAAAFNFPFWRAPGPTGRCSFGASSRVAGGSCVGGGGEWMERDVIKVSL